MMAGLYLTLRGTAIMYYGEEIGMENNDPKNKDEVQDPIGKLGWPLVKGRDRERTPMQWNDSDNAGFSKAKPWLPVPPSYKTHNVASEMKDPNPVLSFYRELPSLRHKEAALLEGDYLALNENDPNVLTYVRRYKDEAILILLNMSGTEQQVRLDFSSIGFCQAKSQCDVNKFSQPGATSEWLCADGALLHIHR
jgi:alpha-glucosidase